MTCAPRASGTPAVIRWTLPCSARASDALDGLPRLTVFTGTHDVLNPDARAFYQRATAEGLEIGWYELEGGMHTWMLMPGHKAKVTLDQIRQVLAG